MRIILCFYRSHREIVRSPTYLRPCNDELFKYSLKFCRHVTLKSLRISFSNACHLESSRCLRSCIILDFDREDDIIHMMQLVRIRYLDPVKSIWRLKNTFHTTFFHLHWFLYRSNSKHRKAGNYCG